MAHLTPSELSLLLVQAAEQVKIGSTYLHYKGQRYQVTGLVIMEDNDQVGVVYRAQYGERLTFVRPLKDWLGLVEHAKEMVPRFKAV